MSRIVLSLLVDNTAGVLSRVAGLFSRRGYNIESLTVGETADPKYSRMTVVSLGDQEILEQIEKQLRKLEDVHDIKELRSGHSVYRELILVKVRANASERMAINAIAEIFRASVVDVGKESVTVMLTGDQSKLDAMINLLEDYEIFRAGQNRSDGTFKRHGGRAVPSVAPFHSARLTEYCIYFLIFTLRRKRQWQRFITRKTVIYHY